MSTNRGKPRRCGKRWLDGDCPPEVLAIFDHGDKQLEVFEVIYTDVQEVKYEDSPRVEEWMTMACFTAHGALAFHHEMQAHEVAAYRYRMKRRYTKWSTLPDAVKTAVRNDITYLIGENAT